VIKTPTRTQQPHRAGSESQESLERAFAHKLTQRLGGQDPALGAQVERRLSAARWQAVEAATRARRARVTARAAALATSSGPGVFSVWWVRLASFVPPLALTLGLIGIDQLNLTQRIEAAAEVDAALLADDLPPTAYTDPGFAEFIKQPQRPAGP
jgi:hypothetical protein